MQPYADTLAVPNALVDRIWGADGHSIRVPHSLLLADNVDNAQRHAVAKPFRDPLVVGDVLADGHAVELKYADPFPQ